MRVQKEIIARRKSACVMRCHQWKPANAPAGDVFALSWPMMAAASFIVSRSVHAPLRVVNASTASKCIALARYHRGDSTTHIHAATHATKLKAQHTSTKCLQCTLTGLNGARYMKSTPLTIAEFGKIACAPLPTFLEALRAITVQKW